MSASGHISPLRLPATSDSLGVDLRHSPCVSTVPWSYRKSRPLISTFPSSVNCRRRIFRSTMPRSGFAVGNRLQDTVRGWAALEAAVGRRAYSLVFADPPNSKACRRHYSRRGFQRFKSYRGDAN